MNKIKVFSWLILILSTLYLGYNLGKLTSKPKEHTDLTMNYAFVRSIAEMASLEVSGTTTLKSSNVTNDGSWSDELKRVFIERTVRLSVPYTAKYGVNLNDSSLRIERTDSILKVYLPQPKLLSYEIHLNRLEASNEKGWFQFENEETYPQFQKKLYNDSRAQLQNHSGYIEQSRGKICEIIAKYFAPMNVKTQCVFEEVNLTPAPSTIGTSSGN
jgi:hypothetical protein